MKECDGSTFCNILALRNICDFLNDCRFVTFLNDDLKNIGYFAIGY